MPRNHFLLIALILSCLLIPCRTESYHWPLDAPRALTSTFAEYRSGHLHAGIDLKTWGQVGYEVYAVGNGYVWRIRTSPWGYGKAIYLRLEDGKTVIYGHLSDFAPSIQQVVEREQTRLGRYSVDISLDPGQIPVRGGQVVGFSGRTGCAHPHLHFELRDEENCPLNPLAHGFSVADHRAPRLTSLSVKPLDWESTVDGQHSRCLHPLSWNAAAGQYQLSGTLHVQGRVGLALAVHDLADGAQNRLHVHALYLFLDDQPVFSATYDRFSYSKTHKVDLDTEFALYRQGRGIYQNLYVMPGNDLPFYRPDAFGSGVIDSREWQPGYHRVRIRAEDFLGNAAQLEFSLLLDQRPQLEDLQVVQDAQSLHLTVRATDADDSVQRVLVEISEDLGRHWRSVEVRAEPGQEDIYEARWARRDDAVVLVRAWAEDQFGIRSRPRIGSVGVLSGMEGEPEFEWQVVFFHDFVEVSVVSDRLLTGEPKLIISQTGEEPRPMAVYQEELRRYRGLAYLIPGSDGEAVISITGRDLSGSLGAAGFSFSVATVTRSCGGRVGDLHRGIAAHFQPGSVYQTFMSHAEEVKASSSPGLLMKSRPFFLYPDDCIFEKQATVCIAAQKGERENDRIGVYRLSRGGKWRYVGRIAEGLDGAIGAKVKSFSTFALLEDQIDPAIWRVRPRNGSRTRHRRPVISAKVRDTGSGIGGEENVTLVLDGQTLISRYDPPVESISYRLQEPLDPGEHLLEVLVRDRAGNQARAQSRFTIIP
jgi:hypothetical protein